MVKIGESILVKELRLNFARISYDLTNFSLEESITQNTESSSSLAISCGKYANMVLLILSNCIFEVPSSTM